MKWMRCAIPIPLVVALAAGSVFAQSVDPITVLAGRLDLEKYKATIKGLTQFGDRRQGTDRNRAAVDWIEAQLRSYGCTSDRIHYDRPRSRTRRHDRAGWRTAARHPRHDRRQHRPDEAAGREAARAQHATDGSR